MTHVRIDYVVNNKITNINKVNEQIKNRDVFIYQPYNKSSKFNTNNLLKQLKHHVLQFHFHLFTIILFTLTNKDGVIL